MMNSVTASVVFKFECPSCSQHLSATFGQIGDTAICPTCNTTFAVPNMASSESPSPRLPPPLPPTAKMKTTFLTKKQEIVILVAIAIPILICAPFFMSPGGVVLLFILFSLLGWRLRQKQQPRDTGTEDDGQALLSRAMKLECQYRTKEALAAYSDISRRYAHTSAGRDARISMEQLQKKTGESNAAQ